MKSWYAFPIVLALAFLPLMAVSQIPQTISYQGVVTDSLGHPKPDGNYTFTFRMYSTPAGGSPIWTEVKDIDVVQGLFTTQLGDVTPFAGSVVFDSPYYLGVKFSVDPEMQPRIPLSSVAYSLSSVKADTASYALSVPLNSSMIPVGTEKGFGTHGVPTSAATSWDSLMITVPAPGFLQSTVSISLNLTDATGCPCVYRGYLEIPGLGYPTGYVSLVTLTTAGQYASMSFAGGIDLPSGGPQTIHVVVYRSIGGGSASAFGNGSVLWIPALPSSSASTRPLPVGDENAANDH